MRPAYIGVALFLFVILLSATVTDLRIAIIRFGAVTYFAIGVAISIFLLTLAWRTTKALEKAAEEQKNIAYFLRELVMQKSNEEKQS